MSALSRKSTVGLAIAALTLAIFAANAASAQQTNDVTIISNDGSISIAGKFQRLEDDAYVIETEQLGLIRISRSTASCTGFGCPIETSDASFGETQEFAIHGSRTVGTTLIPNLLRGYAETIGGRIEIREDSPTQRMVRLYNPNGSIRAEIELKTPGSGAAFDSLVADSAEIGLADRRMNEGDLSKLVQAGLPDLRDTENEIILGLDGIVVITNKAIPVRNLSAEDVSRIYSGEATNWLEFGGRNQPIQVNSYNIGSGDREVMLNGLVRPTGRVENDDVTRWAGYQELVDSVMAQPGGIGFVGRWLARTNDVNLVTIRESCGLTSEPNDFRIKSEDYALSRRLWAYKRPGEINPEAQSFLDWVLTSEAQPYVRESFFVDRELERMRLEDMGMMMIHAATSEAEFSQSQYADMLRTLRDADRLSTAFRFNSGSATLDDVSKNNLAEIAARAENGEFEGYEILLVGFADSVGPQDSNTRLALVRARSVENLLRSSLTAETSQNLPIRALSYGELLPISCNDSERGRARNRRVEIWIRNIR